MRGFIQRWLSTEVSALRQQFYGKSVNARFSGLWRSERNEAKLFLVAAAPIVPVLMIVPKWSAASTLEQAAMVLTGIWFVVVLLIGFFLIIRSIVRVSRNKNG